MKSEIHKKDYQLTYIQNKFFNPDEHVHVATLSKHDLFYIYHHLPSLTWKLIVKKASMDYTGYTQEDEYQKMEYLEENSFDLIVQSLNKIIETEHAYLITHNKRRCHIIPYWLFLDRKYIHPGFVSYFRKNIDQAINETDPEGLNDTEKSTLLKWVEETKGL